MIVKIHKRHQDVYGNWLPYIILNCTNVTPEYYSKLHKESNYKDYKYEIVKL